MQHLLPGHRHHQLPIRIQPSAIRPGETQINNVRVRARRHHKVIFQLARIAIQLPINARIHRPIPHLGEMRHLGLPALRIIAQVIIAVSRQRRQPLHHRLRIHPHPGQLHPHHRRRFRGLTAHRQHRLVRGQQQLIARRPRQELHRRVGLALIRLKMQRGPPERLQHPRPNRRLRLDRHQRRLNPQRRLPRQRLQQRRINPTDQRIQPARIGHRQGLDLAQRHG